jgi:hypothetical protein
MELNRYRIERYQLPGIAVKPCRTPKAAVGQGKREQRNQRGWRQDPQHDAQNDQDIGDDQ